MSNNHDFQSATRLTYAAILIAALGAGAWSTAVMAGEHKDQDSKAMYKEQFDRGDIDRDGRLGRDEYEKMKMGAPDGTSQEMSIQGMPATEHQAEAMRGFEDLDSDGDGYITASELDQGQTTGTSSDSTRSGSSMSDDATHSGSSMQNDATRAGTSMQNDATRSGTSMHTDPTRPSTSMNDTTRSGASMPNDGTHPGTSMQNDATRSGTGSQDDYSRSTNSGQSGSSSTLPGRSDTSSSSMTSPSGSSGPSTSGQAGFSAGSTPSVQ